MGCQHLEDPYELLLLGALSPDAARGLEDHLASGCPACLERVREAAETVYLLSLAAKPARPHPRLKVELLQRISEKQSPDLDTRPRRQSAMGKGPDCGEK